MQTLMKVIEKDVAPPRNLNRSIDRSLERICLKCLKRDPNDRYTSAGALADDLSHWLSGDPISVKPPSLGEAIGSSVRTNLRSALGASLMGAIVGIAFSLLSLINYCQSCAQIIAANIGDVSVRASSCFDSRIPSSLTRDALVDRTVVNNCGGHVVGLCRPLQCLVDPPKITGRSVRSGHGLRLGHEYGRL